LCGSALTKAGFTMAILFLWACRMLAETRDCIRLNRCISSVPGLPAGVSPSEMVYERPGEDEGDEVYDIICLDASTRNFLRALVVVPKTIVCFGLLVLGSVWFSATASFGDLILNALALEFHH